MIEKLVNWTISWALTPYGPLALFIIAFAESSFFPVPPDVLLIALGLLSPENVFLFALICSIGSVTGGMFGYFLGIRGGRPLLEKMFKKDKIEKAHELFQKYEVWAIGIAAFTPVPYKVFTIAAGVFYIDFKKFVLVSIIGRSCRFFIVAGFIALFGEQIKHFLEKYFELVTIGFVILIFLGFYAIRHIKIKGVGLP